MPYEEPPTYTHCETANNQHSKGSSIFICFAAYFYVLGYFKVHFKATQQDLIPALTLTFVAAGTGL